MGSTSFRTAAIAIVLTLATGAASARGVPSVTDQAFDLIEAGKSAEAIALLDPIIAEARAGEAARFDATCPAAAAASLARVMATQGYRVQIDTSTDWCEAMYTKAYALVEMKRMGDALPVLAALTRYNGATSRYFAEYGHALNVTGKPSEALAAYDKAIALASAMPMPRDQARFRAVALRGKGYALFELQDWDGAESAYRDSLKDEPDNAIAKSELAEIANRRPH